MSEVVGVQPTAPETPVNIDRRFFLPINPQDRDYIEGSFDAFLWWMEEDFNCAQQPHPEGPMSEEEESRKHIQLCFERFNELHGTEGEMISMDEVRELLYVSFSYWQRRLAGEEEDLGWEASLGDEARALHDDLVNDEEGSARLLFYKSESPTGSDSEKASHILRSVGYSFSEAFPHADSIFDPGNSLYPEAHFALSLFLIRSQHHMDRNFFPGASHENRLRGAEDFINEWWDTYTIVNQMMNQPEGYISPEQELIGLITAYPLLYILETQFKHLPRFIGTGGETPPQMQRMAYEATYHLSKSIARNAPDLALRLLDAGYALQYPDNYWVYMRTILNHLFTPESVDLLDNEEYIQTPPYVLRDRIKHAINSAITTKEEAIPDQETPPGTLHVSTAEATGIPMEVDLVLDGCRALTDAAKGSKILGDKFDNWNQSPFQAISEETLADMTEILAISIMEEGPLRGLNHKIGLREGIKENSTIINIEGEEYNFGRKATLRELLNAYRIPGRDVIGWRYRLKGMDRLDSAVGINMLPDLKDQFEQLGIDIIGVSSLYGNRLWEAMHLVARFRWDEQNERHREVHIPGSQTPLILSGSFLFEIQIATDEALERNYYTSPDRKRLGHDGAVIISPNGYPDPNVEGVQLGRFYYVVGSPSQSYSFSETLGRCLYKALARSSGIIQGIDNHEFVEAVISTSYRPFIRGLIDPHRKGQHFISITRGNTASTEDLICMNLDLLQHCDDSIGRLGYIRFISELTKQGKENVVKSLFNYRGVSYQMDLYRFILAHANGQNFAVFKERENTINFGDYGYEKTNNSSRYFKVLLDMTLFVTSRMKSDLKETDFTYIEDEPDDYAFVFVELDKPLKKVNDLLLDGKCKPQEMIDYMWLAYQLMQAERQPDVYFASSYGVDEAAELFVSEYLTNPTNLMAPKNSRFYKSHEDLRRELVAQLSTLPQPFDV